MQRHELGFRYARGGKSEISLNFAPTKHNKFRKTQDNKPEAAMVAVSQKKGKNMKSFRIKCRMTNGKMFYCSIEANNENAAREKFISTYSAENKSIVRID